MSSPKKSPQPKRHHFLPQGYLSGFSDDGFVWVYDRIKNACRRQNILNTAVIGQFYSTRTKEGATDPWIETELAKIDALIPSLLRKLKNMESPTPQDRYNLAYIAALMMTRVPDFHESVNSFESRYMKSAFSAMAEDENKENTKSEFRRVNPGASDREAEEFIELLKQGNYNLKVHRNRSLHLMLTLSPKFAEAINSLTTFVVHAPKGAAFITSDRPFCIVTQPPFSSMQGAGLLTPGSLKLVPLSRDLAVAFSEPGEGFVHAELNRDYIKSFNGMIGQMTDRFLIAPSEALCLSWAKRLKLSTSPKIPRMFFS